MIARIPLRVRFFVHALLLLVVGSSPAGAQQDSPPAPNAVYLELGGNALLYSINYDRRFRDNITGRAGFMVMSVSGTADTGEAANVSVALIPVMANVLLGTGSSRLELGGGPLIGLAGGDVQDVEGTEFEFSGFGLAGVTSTFGYRYQPPSGGFLFRASLIPFYSGRPQLWAGLSAGWAF